MALERQCLEVWGSLACFTRPELKVERFSYPVITPSAARSIFDAIYWKPKFQWRITQIEVLEPVRYIALLRNEVKNKASDRTIGQWMSGTAEPVPLWAGAGSENGTPRQTMALKDVRYRLYADIRPWPAFRQELPAMEAQFRRRAAAGQCIYQPYLGCREFPAFFELADRETGRTASPFDLDIGWMLYDVFDLARAGSSADPPMISLFRAQARSGVIDVPEFESEAVRKPREAFHA